jgi:sec-independent protein translocase protein TatC
MAAVDPDKAEPFESDDGSVQPGGEMRLLDHLIELRTRLIRSAAVLLVVFFALVPFSNQLFDGLAMPLFTNLPEGAKLPGIKVLSPFMAPVKVAFFTALFATIPWLLYQAWAFVAPGLYKREKRLALPIMVSAVLLFYGGAAFAYFVVLKGVIGFLIQFAPDSIALSPDPMEYLDFVLMLFLAFGLSFELPVAITILALLGWVTPQQLKEARGYAIVGIFVLAAIVTPPDVISQLLLAIPMCLLYEIGILVAKVVAPKNEG